MIKRALFFISAALLLCGSVSCAEDFSTKLNMDYFEEPGEIPGPDPGPGPKEDGALRLGTYNLWASGEGAGQYKWSARRTRLAQSIVDNDFDIFGFQEADTAIQDELPGLVDDLGRSYQWWFVGGDSQDGNSGDAIGIAYDPQRFELSDKNLFWLSDTPDEVSYGWDETGTRRIACCAVVSDKKNGEYFFLMVTQLPLAPLARANSAALLVEKEKQYNTGRLASFLVGDMNAAGDETAQVFRTYWTDSRLGIPSSLQNGPVGTFNSHDTSKNMSSSTSRLDYIYYLGNVIDFKSYTADSSVYDGVYPSDHFPVTIDFELPSTAIAVSTRWLSAEAYGESPQTVMLDSPRGDWTVDYDGEWLRVELETDATCSVSGGSKTTESTPVYITPEINTTGKPRSGTITFSQGDTTATIEVTQDGDMPEMAEGSKGFPSYWRYRHTVSSTWSPTFGANFASDNYVTTYNGTGAVLSYIRSADNNKIRYNTRSVNATSYYPVVSCNGEGDYWLFSVPVEHLPAGSAIDVYMPHVAQANAAKYWTIEYFDEGQWKAVEEDLRTAAEDSSVKYTGFSWGSTSYWNHFSQTVRFSQSFTNENVMFRLRSSGKWRSNGSISASADLLTPQTVTSCNSNLTLSSDGSGPYLCNYGTGAAPANEKKVLIIGNSFTYYHTSPRILKEVAWTDGGAYIKPYAITRGSQSLAQWTGSGDNSGGRGNDIISWGAKDLDGYDYAIIQDQSQNPATYGRDKTASIPAACKAMADKIRESSPDCKVILEMTWAFPASSYGGFTDYATFDKYNWEGVLAMAQYADTWISPIGFAFKYVRENYPTINLFDGDAKHPSYEGAYLKSCVNYLLIHGSRFGRNVSDGLLDATTASQLRTAAEKVVIDDFYSVVADLKR